MQNICTLCKGVLYASPVHMGALDSARSPVDSSAVRSSGSLFSHRFQQNMKPRKQNGVTPLEGTGSSMQEKRAHCNSVGRLLFMPERHLSCSGETRHDTIRKQGLGK